MAGEVAQPRRTADGGPAWLYVLLEHQSTPDRWLRLRLLKYSIRIRERDRRQHPNEEQLRPIVPLVLYPLLAELGRVGGIDNLRQIVVYCGNDAGSGALAEIRRRGAAGGAGRWGVDDQDRGPRQGRLEGQIGAIENLLRAGAPWPLIESATGIDQAALRALKQQIEAASITTEPTEGSAIGAEDTE